MNRKMQRWKWADANLRDAAVSFIPVALSHWYMIVSL